MEKILKCQEHGKGLIQLNQEHRNHLKFCINRYQRSHNSLYRKSIVNRKIGSGPPCGTPHLISMLLEVSLPILIMTWFCVRGFITKLCKFGDTPCDCNDSEMCLCPILSNAFETSRKTVVQPLFEFLAFFRHAFMSLALT